MPEEEPAFVAKVWRDISPLLLARATDVLQYLILLASLVLVHFAQLLGLSIGLFSPNLVHIVGDVEQFLAAASIIVFLVQSTISFAWYLYQRSAKGIRG